MTLYHFSQWLVTARVGCNPQFNDSRRQFAEIIFGQPSLIGKKFINQLYDLKFALADSSLDHKDFEIGKKRASRRSEHHTKQTERQLFVGGFVFVIGGGFGRRGVGGQGIHRL